MDKTSVGTEESTKAVIRRCSVNKVFGKIVQNSQKNTCAGVSFFYMKFQALRPPALLRSNIFPVNFVNQLLRVYFPF